MSTRAEKIQNIKPVAQEGVPYISAPKTEYTNCVWGNLAEGETLGDKCQYNSTKNDNNINIDEAYIALEPAFEKLGITVEEAKQLKILENIIGRNLSRKGYSKRELELAMVSLGEALGDAGGKFKKICRKFERTVFGWFKNDKTSYIEAVISKANKIYNQNELESIDVKKELEDMISLEARAKLDEKARRGLFVKTRRVFRVKLGLSIQDMDDKEKVKQATRNFVKNKIDELNELKGEARAAKWKEIEKDIVTLLAIASRYPELAEYMPILVSALPSDKRAEILKLSKNAICKNQEASSKYALSVIENLEAIGETDANGNKISQEEYEQIAYDTWKDMDEKTFEEGLKIVDEKTEALFGSRDEIRNIREKIRNKEELTPEEMKKWSQFNRIQNIIDKKNNGIELTPDEEKLYAKYNAIVTLNSTAQIATYTSTNLSEQAAVNFREELSEAAHDYEYSAEVASHMESFLNEHSGEFSDEIVSGIITSIEIARENSQTETSYFQTNLNSQENTTTSDNQSTTNNTSNSNTNVEQSNVVSTSTSSSATNTNISTTGTNTPVYTTNTVVNNATTDETSNPKKENFGLGFQQKMLKNLAIAKNDAPISFEDCVTPEQKRAYRLNIGDEKYYTEVLNSTKKGSDDYTFACKYYEKMTNPSDVFGFIGKLSISALSDVLSNHTSDRMLCLLSEQGNLGTEGATNILKRRSKEAKENMKAQEKVNTQEKV